MYSQIELDSHYFKTKGFYALFMPVMVPYKKIYAMAEQAGLKLREQAGPILEQGKPFGYGWIGVRVEKPASPREDVEHVTGKYETYEHRGPYKSVGKAVRKVMKERPGAKITFNIYLDDPLTTAPENCRTLLLFR